MKPILSFGLFNRSKLVALAALMSVPVTAFAFTDYYGQISNYLVVGSSNYYVSSSSSSSYNMYGILLIGTYCGVTSTNSSMSNAAAVGSYNIIYDSNSMVVGSWNKDTGGDELFILGNGSYSAPSNAMEVFKNGKIRILRQGDISMGAYSN